nr:type I polyketide synthase [Polyangium spumosum]
MKAKVAHAERAAVEPIAVIGLGCRFPGGGAGPEAFWRNLEHGVDAIQRIPAERWPEDAIPGERSEVLWAGLLDDVAGFDATFFGISPREAETLDPQQRMLLEVTWGALEDASVHPERLAGSRTGVFVGMCGADYHELVVDARFGRYDAYCTTGNLHSTAAGRIAYVLGLQGPCISVDTACSSSLVAIAQACQSLRAGDSDMALAGGVNVLLSPRVMAMLAETQALSPDGRCKTLDARANGFVRGEGCGIVALKRLSDAQRDGDRIRAVIRGWAVNQDGRSTGLTTPNVLSQQVMLRQALERARLSPLDIGYIEMHGTGTSLGDPIEFEALRDVLGVQRADGSSIVLGAVKTNIGHLEGAAGVAGFIKAVLAFEHERIPKNLHFRRLNPRISLDEVPFSIPTEHVSWPRGGKPRRAGVSSFGLSGTNAHVILEEPPAEPARVPSPEASAYLLPLSARSPEALTALACCYGEWLSRESEVSLHDIVYTASARRAHHEHRIAIVGKTRAEMAERLSSFAAGDTSSVASRAAAAGLGRPRPVYVFSGQGSQWAGMGRQLLAEQPVFRAAVEEIDALLSRHARFSLVEEMSAHEERSRLGETEIAQPAIFAIQVGLARLLGSWGVTPGALIGHSVGEVAAAHLSGALSLEEAVRLVALRARIMQKATGHGRMAWASLPPEDAAATIAGRETRVSIAAVNDPVSVVLSGETAALEAKLGELAARGVSTRPLRVKYAFHSPQMEPLAQELAEGLGRVDARVNSVPMISTVTGARIAGELLDARYWQRNVRETVDLLRAVETALAEGYNLFVELGPHPVLVANLEQCVAARGADATVLSTLRRQGEELRSILETLGGLYVDGVSMDWGAIHPVGGRIAALPPYPWQRKRYWIEAAEHHVPRGERPRESLDDFVYEVQWRRKDRTPSAKTLAPADGAWLLLVDRAGTGDALAHLLHGYGIPCVRVEPGAPYERLDATSFRIDPARRDDYRRLLEEAFPRGVRCRGIVHMFGLDTTPWNEATEEALASDQHRTILSPLFLAEAVQRKGWRDNPRLCWVTRGAQAVAGSGLASPSQAPLWGLARTLLLEHPELEIARIDLDAAAEGEDARALLEELGAADGEDQVAIRSDGRYVARLARTSFHAAPARAFEVRPDAAYLLSGKLSGRGLATARWMVAQGARHVALAPSRALAEDERGEIRAMEEAGASVLLFPADVSRRADVEALLAEIERLLPPLRGVVHVPDVDGESAPTLELDEERLRRTASKRMLGAWHLHRAMSGRPLDFFVLFSSASAVLGLAGRAGYTASSAFLDAVARRGHDAGLPAMSVQWGAFSDEGGEARQSTLDGLTQAQGVEALAQLLARPRAEVAVMRFAGRQMLETFPHLAQSAFYSELVTAGGAAERRPEGAARFRQTLEAAVGAERLVLLVAHVREQLGHVLRMDPATIDPRAPFQTLGVDSLMSVEVRNRLEASLGSKLPATLLFTYANVEQLAESVLVKIAASKPSVAGAARVVSTTSMAPATPLAAEEPIALVGMACRFPGGSTDPDAYWRALLAGVDGVREVSPARWPAGTLPEDKLGAGHAALLDDIYDFDAGFFGISPREAETLDPQQRLLLEVTWEAVEDAGQLPQALVGSRTGVFVGCTTLDYQRMVLTTPEYLDAYGVTGTVMATAAGRLSYVFGLQGPAVALDTACSSSLVAIHLGCQSLREGESDLVLAGGVNALLAWEPMVAMAAMRALSPDGRCKTLDARANGYVRGEGCGILVLKRLSDARRDGDRVLALIRGSAVNQDGRSTGLTTPNVLAQQALLRQALGAARLSPADVGYVEMHGTGTPLGDPIEVDALREVFGEARPDGSSCVLGAVKTNIGHLEGAAGVAGLIKVVQVLRHGVVPKNLHFRALNPRIELQGTPFVVPTENLPWLPGGKPRRAGVSSFGISGTNAHVLLEEAPPEATNGRATSSHLLPLSARSVEALKALTRSHAEWLSSADAASLPDICYTASVRRTHHEHRLVAEGATKEELVALLSSCAQGEWPAGVSRGQVVSGRPRPKVVFVFPGQGSQWLGMGRGLLAEEPAFAAALRACSEAIEREAGFSVLDELAADEARSRLGEIDVVQPVLFAIEVALASLWRSWGVEPDCVVGHSMGEVAAAHVAGMLSLADGAKVICRRSRLLRRISGNGSMGLVELTMAEAEQAIAGFENRLGVAVSNGPRSTVLSGDPIALEEVLGGLEKRGVFCRRVRVDVASHGPQVDPLRDDLLSATADVRSSPGAIAMRSTVTGAPLRGDELSAAYWWKNLREPVRFSQVVQALMVEGHDVFVEMSPHPILLPSIEENLEEAKVEGVAVASTRRHADERRSMLAALGTLHTRGYDVAWSKLYPEGGRVVSLPAYAWQRERYAIDVDTRRTRVIEASGSHPLLGVGLTPAAQPETHLWERRVSVKAFPYLADHRVQGEVVFPGAGYVELGLAAAARIYGPGEARIEEISFDRMLALPEGQERLVQVSLVEEGGGRASVTISSREGDTKEWVRHASGVLRVMGMQPVPAGGRIEDVEARCPEVIEGALHYEQMEARGLSYGERFQGIARIVIGKDEAVARVRLPEAIGSGGSDYLVHPALLDACFQVGGVALRSTCGEGTLVPVAVTGLQVFERPGREVWVHGRAVKSERSGEPAATLTVHDEAGRVLIEIGELRVQRLADAEAAQRDVFASCVYEVSWERMDVGERREAKGDTSAWLVLVDERGLGATLADRLRAAGATCVEVASGEGYVRFGQGRYCIDVTNPSHWDDVLREAFGKRGCRGVVHCGALDGSRWSETSEATIAPDLRRGITSAMCAAQALLRQGWRDAPRLYLLTRGAQAVGDAPEPLSITQSTLWGFGRALAMEQPDLECIRIDLSLQASSEEPELVLREILSGGDEDQIAFRPGGRYVARLVRAQLGGDGGAPERLEPVAGRAYRLEIHEPGVLERLSLRPMERRPPGPGEVEIEVEAAGLNFLDVMKAMGIYPGMDPNAIELGGECAGRVVALGEGVAGVHVGQEVIVSAASSLASHVTTRVEFVKPKSKGMSFEQAATIPAVFMTVYWALHHVGRLQRGERVLIHAATGGTGLAAIQYARAVGAEIFATAGSEEKRAYLRSLGIEHVMDSRSLAFADEVLACTSGRGVDVVLNSLTGDGLRRSLEVLAPYGRFLDISKKDIYENSRMGMLPFRKSLSYTAIDLAGMAEQRPEQYGALLGEVLERFEDGTFEPEPVTVFPASAADAAFRLMAQARHKGKIAVRMKDQDARLVSSSERRGAHVREDGTYLVTGGLGGLGLSLAKWLIAQGARHLALMGRGAPNEAAREVMRRLTEAGAQVRALRGDVSRRADVDAVIAEIERSMPPLRGVVHAAGLLDDATLPNLDEGKLLRPMEPKVFGGWNLHDATRGCSLDFFVTYSSASALLGSPGQSNYAAANAFLDALCQSRASEGLPATSIQWGAFSEVGLAAASDVRGARVASRGSDSFNPEEGNLLFGRLLERPRPVVGLVRFDVRQWVEFYPQMAGAPYLAQLMRERADGQGAAEASGLREALERAAPAERASLLESHLIEQLARVLRLEPGRIDKAAPFASLGMDSLMSLELRNRLEASLGLKLSAALLFTYATTKALAAHLGDRMFPTHPPDAEAPSAPSASIDDGAGIADEIDGDLGVEEDESALVDKLEAFEEYLG